MKKKSKIILAVLLILIIFSVIPWEDAFNPKFKIGIVEINEPILRSQGIIKKLDYFIKDPSIKGIILRLETPGGGVAASQEIYEKVKNISESKSIPIIASMGDVAASGGYYIAIGADTILANLGTTTGSIGVIMGYPVVSNLLNDLGIEYESITSGKYKDSGSIFRKPSMEDKEYFKDLINNLHNQFVRTVSYERKLAISDVKMLANGKVYSGEQAYKLGLIDMIGTFEDAIKLIRSIAKSELETEIIYPPLEDQTIFDFLFGQISQKTNFFNLNSYPKPQFKLYYGGR